MIRRLALLFALVPLVAFAGGGSLDTIQGAEPAGNFQAPSSNPVMCGGLSTNFPFGVEVPSVYAFGTTPSLRDRRMLVQPSNILFPESTSASINNAGGSMMYGLHGEPTAQLYVSPTSSYTGTPVYTLDVETVQNNVWVSNAGALFVSPTGVLSTTLTNPTPGSIYSILLPSGIQDVRVTVSSFASGTIVLYGSSSFVPDTASPKPTAPAVVNADGAFAALPTTLPSQQYLDTQGRVMVRDYGWNIFAGDTGGSTVTSTTQMLGLSGAGQSYYITDIILSNGGTSQTLQLVSSTTAGNACATSPANVGPPFTLAANGGVATPWKTPRKVAANSAVCCKPGGSTAFSCEIHGLIAP